MRTSTIIALAALAAALAACGGGSKDLSYGVAQQPTFDEQTAADGAQTTLQGSLAFAPSTDVTTGAPGLADQLVNQLGGFVSTASLPPTAGAQAHRALGRATALPFAATVALDPACTVSTETSLTWSGCVVTVNDVDPYTGDTTDTTVRIDGHISWAPATGVTSWDIAEVVQIDMTSGVDTISMDATARLQGSFTIDATTIRGQSTSAVALTENYNGLSMSGAVTNSAVADLTYADPFCITGGTLTVEQRWTRRPSGATNADLPDQGWRFVWTGCGIVTVAHGS